MEHLIFISMWVSQKVMSDLLILHNSPALKNSAKPRTNNNLVRRWDKSATLFLALKTFDMILEVMGCFFVYQSFRKSAQGSFKSKFNKFVRTWIWKQIFIVIPLHCVKHGTKNWWRGFTLNKMRNEERNSSRRSW